MEKRILKISGIIFLLVFSAIMIPAMAEDDDKETIGSVKIIAIGTFERNQDDDVLGHIFLGFKNRAIVFNENIELSDVFGLIIMTNHFLYCTVNE